MKDSQVMRIQPHIVIRVLGSIVALVVILPSVLGLLYAITHWDVVMEDPLALAFPLVIAPIGLFAGYRWVKIGASIGRDEVVLNGWFYSKRIPKDAVWKVSEYRVPVRRNNSNTLEDVVELKDSRDETLGKVPNALTMCRKYKQFVRNLHHLAQFNREKGNYRDRNPSEEVPIQDKPVDEWTAEDFERYEQEN